MFCVFPATSTRQDRIISWRKTTWYVCEKIWYLYLLCNNTLHEMLVKTGILCPFLTFMYVLLYCISPCLFHHLVPPLLSFSCLGLCFFHYLSFCIASFIRGGSRAAATSKMECFVLGCCSSPRSASVLLSHLFLKGNICS